MMPPVFFLPDPLSAWAFAAMRAGMGEDRGEEVEVLLPDGVEALPPWAIPAFYDFPAGEEAWIWVPGQDEGPVPLRPYPEAPSAPEAVAYLRWALEGEIRVPPGLWGMLPGFPEGEPPLAVAAAALGAAVRAEGEAALALIALSLREEVARRPALAATLSALGRPLRPVRRPFPRPLSGHPLVILLERGGSREALGAFRSLGQAPEGLEMAVGALRAALRRWLSFPLEGEWQEIASPQSAALRAAADCLSPEDLRGIRPGAAGFPPCLGHAIAEALAWAGRLPPGVAREILGRRAAWAERAWRIRRGDPAALEGLEGLEGGFQQALWALARRVFPELRRPAREGPPAIRPPMSREGWLAMAAEEAPDRGVAARAILPDPEADPYLALAIARLRGLPALRAVAARAPDRLPPATWVEAEAAAAAIADLAADPAGQPLARRLLAGAEPGVWSRLARRKALPPALGPLLRQAARQWTWETAAPFLLRLPELEKGRALLEELAQEPVPGVLAPAAAWAALAMGSQKTLLALPDVLGEAERREAWLPWRPWRLGPGARSELPLLAGMARSWRLASLMLAIAGWLGRADLAEAALRDLRADPWEGFGHLAAALPENLPAWLRTRLAAEVRRRLEWGGGDTPRSLLALAEALGLRDAAEAFRNRWPFCAED